MKKGGYSRTAYEKSVSSFTEKGRESTFRGKQTVESTGKLDPLVDPAEYGVVRPSRMRFIELPDGRFQVSNGAPSTIEYRLDTTGSMGNNVDIALAALPQICDLISQVLPGRDPFYCAEIFGDYATDRFALCRGQFEVLAERMVNQLTLMHPEGKGGDAEEDPQYGFFGGAYLINAYLHRIELKSMDFTITDAPCHDRLSATALKKIFGKEVFEHAKENGHDINPKDLPSIQDVVQDLLKRSHAFMLLVGRSDDSTYKHWKRYYGSDRIVTLQDMKHVPHVMAVITGLTEGTLDLQTATEFLQGANINKSASQSIVDSVAHIPLNAQCILPNYDKLPKAGDIFENKTDLWPVDSAELFVAENSEAAAAGATEEPVWL